MILQFKQQKLETKRKRFFFLFLKIKKKKKEEIDSNKSKSKFHSYWKRKTSVKSVNSAQQRIKREQKKNSSSFSQEEIQIFSSIRIC